MKLSILVIVTLLLSGCGLNGGGLISNKAIDDHNVQFCKDRYGHWEVCKHDTHI